MHDTLRRLIGIEIICFVDDGSQVLAERALPVLKPGALPVEVDAVILAIGNETGAKIRSKEVILKHLKQPLIRVVDPTAAVSPSAVLEQGVICHALVAIMSSSHVGRNSIISTSASIDHDNDLGEFCNVCPGARTAGYVRMGRGVFLGTGAIVLPGVEIGEYALVGAGAVVTKNVPAHAVMIGAPARVIRYRAEDE